MTSGKWGESRCLVKCLNEKVWFKRRGEKVGLWVEWGGQMKDLPTPRWSKRWARTEKWTGRVSESRGKEREREFEFEMWRAQ